MVSKDHKLSVRRQCALLTLVLSNLFYEPKGESARNLRFMEKYRQAVFADAVVWVAPDGPLYDATRPRLWSAPRAAADAPHAVGAHLPGPQHQPEASAAQDLALPAEERGDRPPEPSLVRRHHLYPDATGLSVSGSHHGLV